MLVNEKSTIWMEKYRPQRTEDLVLPDDIKNKFIKYAKEEVIPNLGLFSNAPGTGKSSTAMALIKEINGEALFINASMENGIDLLRTKIQNFASTSSFDDKIKIAVLDECLEENEEVLLGTIENKQPTKLKDIEPGKVYNCISYNMNTRKFENDTCEVISQKEDDIYEVTLEDGRTIKVTANHPFIVNNGDEIIEKSIDDGLQKGDDIVILD